MLYSNLRAVYRNGKFNLVEPLQLPEGAAVRISIQTDAADNAQSIMKFAGAWQDMTEAEFESLLGEINQRRQSAFTRRRDRETRAD
jgi:predicted DNA-binding antitoxin AbrB/MazE fold protein